MSGLRLAFGIHCMDSRWHALRPREDDPPDVVSAKLLQLGELVKVNPFIKLFSVIHHRAILFVSASLVNAASSIGNH